MARHCDVCCKKHINFYRSFQVFKLCKNMLLCIYFPTVSNLLDLSLTIRPGHSCWLLYCIVLYTARKPSMTPSHWHLGITSSPLVLVVTGIVAYFQDIDNKHHLSHIPRVMEEITQKLSFSISSRTWSAPCVVIVSDSILHHMREK